MATVEVIRDRFQVIRAHYAIRNFLNALALMVSERSTLIYLGFLLFVVALAIFGPTIAPYEPDARMTDAQGNLLRTAPPSVSHPLGTTDVGYDVLSRIIIGARPTAIAGVIGGTLTVVIGLAVGVTAGYAGGIVDDVLMRFTDLVYSVPILVFALVLVGFLGIGFLQSVVVIGLLLWRGSARVFRAQVLQIKERPYILAAKSSGGSSPRIVFMHILPNMASMITLFFATGVGYTIILQAGLSFLGVANPFTPSWGVMIRNAFSSGSMASAWWWSVPPGILLSLTVMSTFMFGRSYERVVGSDEASEEALAQGG